MMLFLRLEPTLKDFSNRRAAQKAKYGGEFFEAEAYATPDGTAYIEFFQTTREGKPKGLVVLRLEELP